MKIKVIHEFVDTLGKTHFDEFDVPFTLGMDSAPKLYRILINNRTNARRVCELFKDCEDSAGREMLLLTCPPEGLDGTAKFEDAKTAIRQIVFEDPGPGLGGLRRARVVDYTNARVLGLNRRMFVDIKYRINSGENSFNATQASLNSLDPAEVTNIVSSHPLWRRLSWLHRIKPLLFANLIGELVDPTWWVNPNKPHSTGMFKDRCGLMDIASVLGSNDKRQILWGALASPFVPFMNGQIPPPDEINQPGMVLVRYGMMWFQHYLKQGLDRRDALVSALWRHNVKLANLLFLNWMEVTHGSSNIEFDERKFFRGDKEAQKASYRACCT